MAIRGICRRTAHGTPREKSLRGKSRGIPRVSVIRGRSQQEQAVSHPVSRGMPRNAAGYHGKSRGMPPDTTVGSRGITRELEGAHEIQSEMEVQLYPTDKASKNTWYVRHVEGLLLKKNSLHTSRAHIRSVTPFGDGSNKNVPVVAHEFISEVSSFAVSKIAPSVGTVCIDVF